MLPEAYYLRCLMEAYHAGLRSPQKLAPSHFVTISEYVDFNRSVVSSYLEHIRQRYSRTKRIVLKEPDLTKYFPQLHQLCHDAQFICMVRDPRDTVSSILNVFLRKLEQGAEDYQSSLAQSRDVEQICHYCISFYKPLFSNSIGRSLESNPLCEVRGSRINSRSSYAPDQAIHSTRPITRTT